MNRGLKVAVVILVAALCTGIPSLHADWSSEGTLICGNLADQYTNVAAGDGAGGLITAWSDYRLGGYTDIYAQRIDQYGSVLWTVDGVPVCRATDNQRYTRIVSDGAGGAIMAWRDERTGRNSIFAQRIDSLGTALWTADGDTVIGDDGDILSFNMISDGAGGAIVIWMDYRNGDYDLYAQRLGPGGARLWDPDGVPACVYTGNQDAMNIVPGSGGTFIFTWFDRRVSNLADIYAQKIDTTGALLWDVEGVPVCTDASGQYRSVLATDGAGGAIIAWYDERNGDRDIYAQRLNGSGDEQWTSDGVLIEGGDGDQTMPQIISDGAGGAIILYYGEMFIPDIFVQRVDGNGIKQWWEGGVPICAGLWEKYAESICTDGAGGAIIGFYDGRDSGYFRYYGQRLSNDGEILWNPSGVPLYTVDGELNNASVTSDGAGGAYFVWEDDRNGGQYDVFATRLNEYGGLGGFYAPPLISSAADVPNDQGGQLSLRWDASAADTLPDSHIEYYSTWRLLPELGAGVGAAAGDLAALGMTAGFGDAVVRHLVTAAGDTWEWLANVPAHHVESYGLTVASLYDSMGSDPGWQYFVVTAHTADPAIYFNSPVDSGYSVDNLPPGLPLAFGGIQSLAPPGLHLYWELGAETDLSHYDVYKGATEDFVPGGGNFVGSAADTMLLDTGWTPGDEDFFKLVAVDVHGNKGPSSTLRPENIYVGTLLQSFQAAVGDLSIRLSWTLSEVDEGMEFIVSRSEEPAGIFTELRDGRIDRDGLSFVFDDRSCEPGITYCYRIEVDDGDGRRILLETEGIKVPDLTLTLFQNVPNPFNPSTSIEFLLPGRSHVRVDVYDVAGRLVTTLLDEKRQAGRHTVEWDGRGNSGGIASSGVYFYRLRAGKFEQTRKMILLR